MKHSISAHKLNRKQHTGN